jgi:hypothetical protein
MADHDPAVPFRNGKWEIVAQRLAMGDPTSVAHRTAGYRSKNPGNDGRKLLSRHPAIRKRADYLKERMFDRQVDTRLVTREEIILGLKKTIDMAVDAEKPQLGVAHSCWRTMAEMEGHLIKKSELKRVKEDPFEDASPQQLIDMITRAAEELGAEVDPRIIDITADSPAEDAGPQNGGHADQEAGLLQALPEGSGLPQ